ncbi:MAG: rhodanese-like domain-containing protein [Betaproteobacteria bacterium]|nr:rhodanese-like domain-containing protein [Betaproteobacteria bacterium]
MFAFLMGLPTVSPGDLYRMVQTKAVAVFDVNNLQSWQLAHVPGAAHLDPIAFDADDLPGNRSASLVFYCSNPFCRKAPTAARRARQLGYTDVMVMSAGIKGWLDANFPTESGA